MIFDESWLCKSCGRDCSGDPKDYYMLKDAVWKRIFPAIDGMLCMDCVEKKLGRKLLISDIELCPLTEYINPYTRAILTNTVYVPNAERISIMDVLRKLK